MVLLILPDRPKGKFSPPEGQAIEAFEQAVAPDRRLFPISMAPDRDHPSEPLEQIKSFSVHSQGIDRLATFLLNQMCLRMAGDQRKLFLSYRLIDGAPWCKRLSEGLRARGYEVSAR